MKARSETRQRTGIYLQALLSPGERKNARQSAEIMGNVTSCRAQQFLYRPIWDPDQPSLLFLDRGPWYQGPPIQALLAANPRLELVYFPTAAPDLNPQEIGYAQCSSGRIG